MQLSMLASTELYTAGYQGRTPEAFVRLLERHQIRRVIDVRAHPVSRKPGFGKSALQKVLEAAGVEYVHLKEAGNPFRHDPVSSGHWSEKYAAHLDAHPEIAETVAKAAEHRSSVLLCFEREPDQCHRTILAERVATLLKVNVSAI